MEGINTIDGAKYDINLLQRRLLDTYSVDTLIMAAVNKRKLPKGKSIKSLSTRRLKYEEF